VATNALKGSIKTVFCKHLEGAQFTGNIFFNISRVI